VTTLQSADVDEREQSQLRASIVGILDRQEFSHQLTSAAPKSIPTKTSAGSTIPSNIRN
jgi:hypothetical protein